MKMPYNFKWVDGYCVNASPYVEAEVKVLVRGCVYEATIKSPLTEEEHHKNFDINELQTAVEWCEMLMTHYINSIIEDMEELKK